MRHPHPLIAIGDIADCHSTSRPEHAVIHACKTPCHQDRLGYRGSLPNTHPHYLTDRTDTELWLNIIDPPRPLFHIATFTTALAFIDEQLHDRPVLIHCNRGESRAPTIALLWLAANTELISDESFPDACADMRALSPPYNPGPGLVSFLTNADIWRRITQQPALHTHAK